MCFSLVRSRAISLVRGVVFVSYAVAVDLFQVTTLALDLAVSICTSQCDSTSKMLILGSCMVV